MDFAFLHRDGDANALAHRGHLRVAERHALVAVVLIEVLDVLEVLVELRRHVEVLLADPGDEVVSLHFLHLAAQTAVGEAAVADEVDRGHLGLDAFVDDENDLLLARGAEVFHDRIDLNTLEAAFGVGALDCLGRTLDQRLLDRIADVQVDLVALQGLVDLGLIELFVAPVLDRADAGTLLDDGAHHDPGVALLGLDPDVIEKAGLPEVQEVALDGRRVVRLSGGHSEVDADGVAGDRGVAGGFEPLDELPAQVRLLLGRGRRVGDPAAGGRIEDHPGPRAWPFLACRRSLGPRCLGRRGQDREHH